MPVSDQGNLRGRYTLIPRTLIFITCGERVLMIKGSPSKRLWANLYNGIGGHVERGEDILSAARRELLEEAGLDGVELRLCGTVTIDSGTDTGIGLFVFRGECDRDEIVAAGQTPGLDEREVSNSKLPKVNQSDEGELEWVEIDCIKNLPLVEDLHILLPLIFEMKRTDPPFSAHFAYDPEGKMVIRFGSRRVL